MSGTSQIMEASVAKMDTAVCPAGGDAAISGSGSQLKNGVWPRSAALWMAAFYVALFIIRPWEVLFPELAAIRFERIYAICMIVAVLVGSRSSLRTDLQTAAVILFFIGVGISGLFAWDASLSWEPFYEYLTLVIFYFVLILAIRTPYQLVFLVACYIITMAAYLAKAQWEYFVHDAGIYDMGVHRMVGIESTFSSPNSLAMSIVVSMPMLLFLYSIRKKFTWSWPRLWRKAFPWGLGVYLGLAITSVALTNSRSGMLGFILFVLLLVFRGRRVGRRLAYLAAGIVVLLLTWVVLPAEQKGRFRSIWDPTAAPPNATVSAQGRERGLKAGLIMFERFPLTGVGIGSFQSYRAAHVDGGAYSAHNLVGQLLGETGLVGGLTFALMVGATLTNCRKVRVVARGRDGQTLEVLSALAVACRDAIILLAFEGLFGHNVRRFNWLWLAAFSLLALQYAQQAVREKRANT